jgi:tetratricopeptide (TPR) repeat protein
MWFRLALLSLFTAALSAQNTLSDWNQIFSQAEKESKPVLVDFYAVWCGPCKVFKKDQKNDPAIQAALKDVLFLAVDAEKEDGPQLAEKQGVQGYPTFILFTSNQKQILKWTGYGKDHFLETLTKGLKDPRPFEDKVSDFQQQPTAALAQDLADMYTASGDAANAEQYYQKAEQLDPSLNFDGDRFEIALGRRDLAPEAMYAELKAFASRALPHASLKPRHGILMYWVLSDMAHRLGKEEDRNHFLSHGVPYIEKQTGEMATTALIQLKPNLLLFVDQNPEEAVRAYKSLVPQDWQTRAEDLNQFAWWCFENNVNLEEAAQMAQKALPLCQPGREEAMALDTLAQIQFKQGKKEKAIATMEEAIAADPSNPYWKQQLEQFKAQP